MFGYDNLPRNDRSQGKFTKAEKEKLFVSPIVSDEIEMDPFLTFLPFVESVPGTPENVTPRARSRSSKLSPKAALSICTPFQLDPLEPKVRTTRRGRAPSSRSSSFVSSPTSESGVKFRPAAEYAAIETTPSRLLTPRSAQDDGDNDSKHAIQNLEENLTWAIQTAPGLFWSKFSSGLKENDEWRRFDAVYRASTSLATEFVLTLEGLSSTTSQVNFCGQHFDAFRFVCDNVPGILMSTRAQKVVDLAKVEEIFDTFYTCGFKAMNIIREDSLDEENSRLNNRDLEECETCSEGACVCWKIVSLFQQANRALQDLGLMEELAGPRVYAVISKEMSQRVDETCSGKYETSHIDELADWLKQKVLPWIEIVYPDTNLASQVSLNRHDEFSRLLMEVYGKAIIHDMFSIIIEFPDSQPILEDLRMCMHQANLRDILVNKLKWALERRLLNAGVSTNSVLDAYCNCVKALKFVDASGILVQLITPPVREYLKHREETVRVILVSLTEESGDLAEELSRNPSHSERKARLCGLTWNEWKPDPIDVPRDKFNLRKSDLIQALVSIYGSKTLFIDEYRALLADRLLRMPKPGPITREIKCLELLKLRFGDSNLQKCEVMLKDVSDSQRLNTRFYDDEGAILADEDVRVTGLVVSAQFWPTFKQESLNLPPVVSNAFEKYTKAFEAIKGNRTLEWQNHVGTVEIEIENDGVPLSFICTPSQAVIMYHFSQEDAWKEEKLAEACGMSVATLQNRIGFWTSKGIVSEASPGTYRLCSSFVDVSGGSQQSPSKYAEESEADFPLTSTSKQRENDLQTFWSYIEAMLTNLESLPLSRIHSMLKLFATVECSVEALQKFLDEKVSQNCLAYSGGQYQLPK
ncbi:unnamed protein product [Allacma fusca]|uniref:Cullin family profile domain-containing protein n=1 Tax=Allacma fusca TaxID=39272 RepID=A0A8J2LEG8_9HEXA|nr:unnamed protein product [Allacma fusca]